MVQLTEAQMLADEVAQLPALRARMAERAAAGDLHWARDVAAIITGIELRAHGRITVHCMCGWSRENVTIPDDLDPADWSDLRDLKIGTVMRHHPASGNGHRAL
jgi:hypothetical protein